MATNPKPGSTGAMRRLGNSQPPAAPRRPVSNPAAPALGAGQLPPVRDRATPPPPTSQGAPAPRPVTRPTGKLSTQGMTIKTKIVIAMSGLAIGISLMLVINVMIITTASLDSTIEQSGIGMLQQAEAIHRAYRAGLTDKALIAYFNQPENKRDKFGAEWRASFARDFHRQIPPCSDFSTWEQLYEDRLWIKVAAEIVEGRANIPATGPERERLCADILGPMGAEVARLGTGIQLPEPPQPRRVNDVAMEQHRSRFDALFQRYLEARGSERAFSDLRARVNQETQRTVTHGEDGRGGLRRKIFMAFREEFVRDLDRLTGDKESQVKYVTFVVADNALQGFDSKALTVISPQVSTETTYSEGEVKRQFGGRYEVFPNASITGAPAYMLATKAQPSGDTIKIFLDRAAIESRKSTMLTSILGISLIAILLGIGLAFLIGGSITKPLQTLMGDIQVISGGNFEHRPRARSKDEIGIVSRLLGDMAAGLKAAQDVWLENQGRKHDLDIAKEIQENLLPKHVPRIAGYDVSAYYSPSKEVGGDYYDFFLVDKTHLGMVCADVSGKGIPGSMVMMMTKALVSYEAQENLSPRDIFCKVNRTLAKDIKRGMFVTAFYMLLDIPTARLTLASAGHNPLLLYRAATRQCTQVNPGGIALGFDKDGRLFERNMKEEVIQLQRGDRAVIFTDGVTEAMGPNNEEFGEERMMAITVQCANMTSSEYLTTLVNAIQQFAKTDEQHDDITIVTLKVG